jgi:hypothetical protein
MDPQCYDENRFLPNRTVVRCPAGFAGRFPVSGQPGCFYLTEEEIPLYNERVQNASRIGEIWKLCIDRAFDEACHATTRMEAHDNEVSAAIDSFVRIGAHPGHTDVLNMGADIQALNRIKHYDRQTKDGPFGTVATSADELRCKGITNSNVRRGAYAGESPARYNPFLEDHRQRTIILNPNSPMGHGAVMIYRDHDIVAPSMQWKSANPGLLTTPKEEGRLSKAEIGNL